MIDSIRGFNPDYSESAPTPDELKRLDGYAVLEFGTPWCGHCQRAAPTVREVLSTLGLPHIKIFDGKGRLLGRRFRVKLWPTLILLHAGREVARVVRPTSVADLKALSTVIDKDN